MGNRNNVRNLLNAARYLTDEDMEDMMLDDENTHRTPRFNRPEDWN